MWPSTGRIEQRNRKEKSKIKIEQGTKPKKKKEKIDDRDHCGGDRFEGECFSRSPDGEVGRATREKCDAYSLRYSWRVSPCQ
jgi:hypothetical protein